MDIKQAFDNIVSVVRAYKGTASEHEDLKESLQKVADDLNAFLVLKSQSVPPVSENPLPERTIDTEMGQ